MRSYTFTSFTRYTPFDGPESQEPVASTRTLDLTEASTVYVSPATCTKPPNSPSPTACAPNSSASRISCPFASTTPRVPPNGWTVRNTLSVTSPSGTSARTLPPFIIPMSQASPAFSFAYHHAASAAKSPAEQPSLRARRSFVPGRYEQSPTGARAIFAPSWRSTASARFFSRRATFASFSPRV